MAYCPFVALFRQRLLLRNWWAILGKHVYMLVRDKFGMFKTLLLNYLIKSNGGLILNLN